MKGLLVRSINTNKQPVKKVYNVSITSAEASSCRLRLIGFLVDFSVFFTGGNSILVRCIILFKTGSVHIRMFKLSKVNRWNIKIVRKFGARGFVEPRYIRRQRQIYIH